MIEGSFTVFVLITISPRTCNLGLTNSWTHTETLSQRTLKRHEKAHTIPRR